MVLPLLGKCAVVTGGGSGIGRAVCNILVRDGAKVIVADYDVHAANETISLYRMKTASAVPVELHGTMGSSIEHSLYVSKMFFKLPPSIMVHSTTFKMDAYFLKMNDFEFDSALKANMKGTFLMMQVFAQSLIQKKIGGSIINISTIAAKSNNIGQANYAASEAGVLSLTKVGSKEFGKYNIRVNAILPGYIDTPMAKGFLEKDQNALVQKCPLGRIGKPEEVAEVVSFLCSEKASYINGALIEVTGGL